MKKNKIISLALASVMSLTLLAGCSSTDSAGADEHVHIDYSNYFTEEGYFVDVTANDYVELVDYSNMVVPYEYSVADMDYIQSRIDAMLEGLSESVENTDANAVIENGTTVNIDYVGSVDGVEFEGGSTQGAGTEVTIGVTSYIDGFLEQLIGHKKGDEFDIEVTFPDSYPNNTDLEGKDAVFSIKINQLYTEVVPEFTDEFVDELFDDISTVDEYMDLVVESYVFNEKANYIVGQLIENSNIIEIPQSMIDFQEALYKDQIEHTAESYGMTTLEYLELGGFESMDSYIESLQSSTEESLTYILIFQAIAEKENVEISMEDINQYFVDYMDVDDWTDYEESFGIGYIKMIVMRDTIITNFVNELPVAQQAE